MPLGKGKGNTSTNFDYLKILLINKLEKINNHLSSFENKFNSAFVDLTTFINHWEEKSRETLKIAEHNSTDITNLQQQVEQKN